MLLQRRVAVTIDCCGLSVLIPWTVLQHESLRNDISIIAALLMAIIVSRESHEPCGPESQALRVASF